MQLFIICAHKARSCTWAAKLVRFPLSELLLHPVSIHTRSAPSFCICLQVLVPQLQRVSFLVTLNVDQPKPTNVFQQHFLNHFLTWSSVTSCHQAHTRTVHSICGFLDRDLSLGISCPICSKSVIKLNNWDCLIVHFLLSVVSVWTVCHNIDLAPRSVWAVCVCQCMLFSLFRCCFVINAGRVGAVVSD